MSLVGKITKTLNEDSYHEPAEDVPQDAKELHRTLESLCEELQAVDWYTQRIETTKDQALVDTMKHARGEEMEHASLLLAWLANNVPEFKGKMVEKLLPALQEKEGG